MLKAQVEPNAQHRGSCADLTQADPRRETLESHAVFAKRPGASQILADQIHFPGRREMLGDRKVVRLPPRKVTVTARQAS